MSVSKILQTNITCQSSGWVNLGVNNINVCGSITGPGAPTEVFVRNSSTAGSSLVTEPSPKNYEIRRLRASTGINLIDNPDYVEIESSVNSYSLAAARLGIDTSSNPGPIIGGLLFDPTLTLAGTFAIPLTSAPFGSGVCENFLDDVDNYFTLISPTQLQINVSGKYNLSGNVIVLSNDALSLVALQVLRSVDAMFSSPPAMTNAVGVLSTGTSPISGIYSNIYTMGFAQDCTLVAGEIINMKLYAEGGSGGDTAEISLCSSLSIHLIGGTSSGAGSAVNAVNSLGAGESLLNPGGAVPIIGVKSLVAGTGITLTPTANDLTITPVAANGFVTYQSLVPDPAPNGVAPTNVWLPTQTLTVTGTILPSSKLVIAYDGWWINPDPAATVTGQFIIYVTSPSAVVTTSQLTISVLRQSLPTVTDFMATQSQNYVMPITQLGNYTIEVRGSTALSATASGLWNFYAYVTN